MRQRLGLALLATLVAVIAWGLLGAAPEVAAQSCGSVYIIQPGDTLSGLARRFGTTAASLARANAIRDLNLIYWGQPLCIPAAPRPTPTPVAREPSRLIIEASYFYTPTAQDAALKLDRRAGIRVTFPLGDREQGVASFPTAADVRRMMRDRTNVRFWISRAPGETGYTLVSVGRGEELDALNTDKDASVSGQSLVPSGQRKELAREAEFSHPLGGPGTRIRSLNVWLEGVGGQSFPLPIDYIGHGDTPAAAARCCSDVFLVLTAEVNGVHKATMVLTEDIVGPPERPWTVRCQGWSGGGWYYRWLSAWFGC